MLTLSRAMAVRSSGIVALLSALALSATAAAADWWPTAGHDPRRTGQSAVSGPARADEVLSRTLPRELSLNMPATVAPDGTVFVGSWGIVRSYGLEDRELWHKSDGKLFAFSPELEPVWDSPFPARLVPYCADLPDHPPTPPFCPEGGTFNPYNGTIEGTPAIDPARGVLYVGRGDGKLYAVDLDSGNEVWAFPTFDPERRHDPDGGGEIIAAPVLGPDGTVYFATAGVGAFESNAVYAVTPAGELRWRYPHDRKSMENVVLADPALSPDGRTLYVAGAWGPTIDGLDDAVFGRIWAFDLEPPQGTGDERLRWVHEPVHEAKWWRPTVWTTALAVGADGTIYGAGGADTLGRPIAALYALRDLGSGAELAWPEMVDLDGGEVSHGLALREEGGVTTRVYATSGALFDPLLQGYFDGGGLFALDPETGAPLWAAPFRPGEHGGSGSMTGIAIDRDGVLYTGVSGRTDAGTVYAVTPDGTLRWSLRLDGLLEWGHPVLGPRGDLYVTDGHRCLFSWLPVEDGACDGVDIDPTVYVVAADRESCSQPAPPFETWLATADLPGFEVQVQIDGERQGVEEPDCIPETLCVSGAVPGRSEVFVRVVGPKPNGRLWPTLVKFSTALVEVWIRQLSTGDVQYYELRGATPGFDELPGLFDREGFEP